MILVLVRKDPVPNLSPLWPTILPKMAKNDPGFLRFSRFWPFWSPNSNLTQHNLGLLNLFVFMIFCQRPPYASTFHFYYIFRSFCALDHLSLWYFIFSFFLHSYLCRRSSNRVCSCLLQNPLLIKGRRDPRRWNSGTGLEISLPYREICPSKTIRLNYPPWRRPKIACHNTRFWNPKRLILTHFPQFFLKKILPVEAFV